MVDHGVLTMKEMEREEYQPNNSLQKKAILRILFLQLFQLLAVQILLYGKGSFLLHDIA